MKRYTIYECEICGKKSKDQKEILQCEAAHIGLTVDEKQEWERLKEDVRHKSAIVSITKNEETDKAFDDAIAKVMEFEKQHGIKQ